MDKRAKELVAELNEIGDALWSTNALRGSQVKGVARRLEQALATLEQPASEPNTINLLKYLDPLALRIKKLGVNDPWYVAGNVISILQELCPPPSVRPVTGNAPRSALERARAACDRSDWLHQKYPRCHQCEAIADLLTRHEAGVRERTLEEAAQECERHATFCKAEAH